MKFLNFGYLLSQEELVSKMTLTTFSKPLKVLDESTNFFMKLMEFVLTVHESTRDKGIKNYCKYYLTTCNAILHMIRVIRYSIVTGYYGNAMVLMRTIINYLNMSIYIHHHPEDAELLLKETRDSFKENKEYKRKFHEYNLKKELEKIGYKVPSEYDDIAKSTHGSLWGAQAFGFKGLKTPENEFELQYSPKFSMVQSTTYISFIVSVPIDFATYCIQHFKERGLDIDKRIIELYKELDRKVLITIYALEENYKFVKNTPDDIQNALVKRIDEAKKIL